jgi:hypothetical protein
VTTVRSPALRRISLLAVTVVAGCAGESDAGGPQALPTCQQTFQACGGDVLGRWELRDYCFTETGSSGWYEDCPESTSGLIEYEGTVTYEFAADGTLTVQDAMSSTIVYRVPTSCPDVSCSGLQEAMQSAIVESGDQGTTSCSVLGPTCTCTVRRSANATITQQYEISGTELVIVDPSGRSAAVPYCVDGDTLVMSGRESFEFSRAPSQS